MYLPKTTCLPPKKYETMAESGWYNEHKILFSFSFLFHSLFWILRSRDFAINTVSEIPLLQFSPWPLPQGWRVWVHVGPCGPQGHLSGNLSSQVREEGHLDTGAGINVALPVLPKRKTKALRKHLKTLLLQTFHINHSTDSCNTVLKPSQWFRIFILVQ